MTDQIQIPVAQLVGFLFAVVRTSAFMVLAPPFNTKSVPRKVKIGLSAGIALVLASKLPAESVSLDTGYLLKGAMTQMITGLVLGMLVMVLFNAIMLAGTLIDNFGGFTVSMALDPMLNVQSSIFGRFYSLIGTTLLFVINGHLMIIKGFMTSFDAVPLTGVGIKNFTDLMIRETGMLMLAAVEIAGPLLAAYFLTEVAMGFLSKAAPQMNVQQFGFPLKILLTLLMIGAALPLVPGAMHTLVDDALNSGINLLHSNKSNGNGA